MGGRRRGVDQIGPAPMAVISGTVILLLAIGLLLAMGGGPDRTHAAGDGKTVFRALLVSGEGTDVFVKNDNVSHLREALLGGQGNAVNGGQEWLAGNIVPVNPEATKQQVKDAVAAAPIKDADDDDLTLIFINSHAGKVQDNDSDEFGGDVPVSAVKKGGAKTCAIAPQKQCDERVLLKNTKVLDDDLPPLLSTIKGTKAYLIDTCFAAGQSVDGFKDLPQDPNAVLLFSSKSNERSWGDGTSFGHPHTYFAGLVVAGLTDAATGSTGFARADTNQNGEVTVSELFGFVQPRVDPLARSAPPTQYPDGTEIHQNPDEFRLGTFGNTAVFRYKDAGKATSTVKKHSIPAAVANVKGSGCEDCPDGGDCSVGGVGEPVTLSGGAASESAGGAGPSAGAVAAIAGGAAAVLAAAATGGWYARRRFRLRRTGGLR